MRLIYLRIKRNKIRRIERTSKRLIQCIFRMKKNRKSMRK